MTRPRSWTAALAAAAALAVAGCSQQGIDLDAGEDDRIREGAQLFVERCGGCHTLESAGTQGSAVDIRNRERTDGPNFNTRPVTRDAALYAIRNGGFSGAIMPQDIVVGEEAEKVADYLAKYSGRDAESPISPDSGGGEQP